MMKKTFDELEYGDVITVKVVVGCRTEKGLLASVVTKTRNDTYFHITENDYIECIETPIVVGSQWNCNDGSTWQLIAIYKNELYLFEVGNEERTILVKANMVKRWKRIK